MTCKVHLPLRSTQLGANLGVQVLLEQREPHVLAGGAAGPAVTGGTLPLLPPLALAGCGAVPRRTPFQPA